ncbi:hypothetical protein DFH06DRAFT_1247822 [Mycena polygramma]|nr:hypothetical protein DFH06DRAFT_1247822 [Mycena polygramma]
MLRSTLAALYAFLVGPEMSQFVCTKRLVRSASQGCGFRGRPHRCRAYVAVQWRNTPGHPKVLNSLISAHGARHTGPGFRPYQPQIPVCAPGPQELDPRVVVLGKESFEACKEKLSGGLETSYFQLPTQEPLSHPEVESRNGRSRA